MKIFLVIAAAVAFLYIGYLFSHRLLSRFAAKELAKSGLSWRVDGAIHMEAMVDSMEYYARMALILSYYHEMPVVIHIPRADVGRTELLFIGERLARRYPHLSVELF